MNVVICSSFRNAETYLSRYVDQVTALDRLITKRGDVLSLVLGYGDSTDDTDALLFDAFSGGMLGARLVDCTHNGPVFGSIVDAQRFKQLAYVANKVLANIPGDADAVIWIESDLIWEPETIIELLNHLQWHACVAPMVLDSPPKDTFYDIFCFRRNDRCFTKEPPYHEDLLDKRPLRMDSVGSCIALQGDIARKVTVPAENVLIGTCAQIRRMSQSVILDPALVVYHP